MTRPPLTALFTDFYQLTMMQGYFAGGLHRRRACFDLFFRHNPFGGGYAIAAGIDDALLFLQRLAFRGDDLAYLKSLGAFRPDFLRALRKLRFTGEAWGVEEGSLVFAGEPILRVTGPLWECQLVESALLNIVNFQTLIATKAARVCQEAAPAAVMEFGMRRAQGPDGALSAARAAFVGGCSSTSNVLAAKTFGIPARGTHAHSWVLAHGDEWAAFCAFARLYPDNAVLLVDTYDTLKSGVPNAIRVARAMKARGERLAGIRLDSGDLAYLSIEARRALDRAGFPEVQIVCSGDLDEYLIRDLKAQGARIDAYGVGTNLVAARGDPALAGIYKLAAVREGNRWRPTAKVTEKGSKLTLPGIKQVWRLLDGDGMMIADWIELDGARPDFRKGVWGRHPQLDYSRSLYRGIAAAEPLLKLLLRRGRRVAAPRALEAARAAAQAQLARLHPTCRRIVNPHIYKVSVGPRLYKLVRKLIGRRGRAPAGRAQRASL